MRRIFLLFITLFSLNTLTLHAQNCTPDNSVDTFGVFPAPDTSEVLFSDPTLGISTLACAGQPFEFTFTAGVPATINAEPFIGVDLDLPLVSVTIVSIDGLGPLGWTQMDNFLCEPGSCVFVPDPMQDVTLGCAKLFGVAPAAPGDYSLVFTIDAVASLAGTPVPVTITYPDGDAFPGQYIVRVLGPSDPACGATSTQDLFTDNVLVSQNVPNPFSGVTEITLNSRTADQYEFKVFSITGKMIHQEEINASAGENIIRFNGNNLNSGIYMYSIGNGEGLVTKRMVLSK